jgi:hypothetical protein
LPEFGLEWNGILASAYSLIMDVVTAASGIVCCQARVITGRENLHGCGYGGLNLVNKKRARMIERVSLEMGCKGLIVQLGVSKLLFAGDEVETVPAR